MQRLQDGVGQQALAQRRGVKAVRAVHAGVGGDAAEQQRPRRRQVVQGVQVHDRHVPGPGQVRQPGVDGLRQAGDGLGQGGLAPQRLQEERRLADVRHGGQDHADRAGPADRVEGRPHVADEAGHQGVGVRAAAVQQVVDEGAEVVGADDEGGEGQRAGQGAGVGVEAVDDAGGEQVLVAAQQQAAGDARLGVVEVVRGAGPQRAEQVAPAPVAGPVGVAGVAGRQAVAHRGQGDGTGERRGRREHDEHRRHAEGGAAWAIRVRTCRRTSRGAGEGRKAGSRERIGRALLFLLYATGRRRVKASLRALPPQGASAGCGGG